MSSPLPSSLGSRVLGLCAALTVFAGPVVLASATNGEARKNVDSAAARLIDIDVVDAAVKDVIEMIKREAEVEIVYNSDDLRGSINLSLKQRTVDFALQIICDVKGLKFYRKEGVYFIVKGAPAALPESSRNDPPMPSGPGAISRRPNEVPIPMAPDRSRTGGSLVPTGEDLVPLPRIDIAPKVAAEKMTWSKITMRYLSASMIGHLFNPDLPDRSPSAVLAGMAANASGTPDYLRHLGLTPGRSPIEELGGPMLRDHIGTGPGLYRSNRSQLIGPGGGASSGGFNQFGGGLGGGGLGGGGLGGGGLGGGGLGGGGLGGAGGGGSIPRPAGIESILAFDPLNALIVRGTESAIAELQELINLLDRPLKQVLIEAQFVDVSTTVSDSFAIQWQLQQGPFNIAVQFPAGGDVQVGYVRGNFRAQLGLLESQNKAKTVLSPRVIALNNALAFITSTEVRWIVVQTQVANIGGQGQQSRIPIPITIPISLSAIPTIHDDGTVTVAVAPIIETATIINQDGVTLPNIRFATTLVNVTLRDGDTAVVGGLVQNNRTAASSRVPFLARLPLVGSLFRTRNNLLSESELLIFITVHLLPNVQDDSGTGAGRAGGGL